jgi:hypothetical protein
MALFCWTSASTVDLLMAAIRLAAGGFAVLLDQVKYRVMSPG